jgi:predicted Rossmann fold nucleotide-binding protein DprA/Smf involved in DNA uptake
MFHQLTSASASLNRRIETMLASMSDEPKTSHQIAAESGETVAGVTRLLNALAARGLVKKEAEGKTTLWRKP